MNENINLCEILKGHEGETFYSPCFGKSVLNAISHVLYFQSFDANVTFDILPNGSYCASGEICIFPSKNQRDWNKWLEEQKPKVPKTWNELCEAAQVQQYEAITDVIFDDNDKMIDESSAVGENIKLAKSALALLKIHQLIEVGYGRNVTKEDYINDEWLYTIIYSSSSNNLEVIKTCHGRYNNITFHTKEQAEEFLKYPKNVQLLKDYFMI